MAYNEGVPLLSHSNSEPSRFQSKPNPLPWPQLSIMLFVKTCDALATQSIKPFINEVRTAVARASMRLNCIQLVGGLDIIGGDERKVGYYVGLIVSYCY